MSTQVFLEEFKGYPILAIYKVDKRGHKIGNKPIVSFGATKARAILAHIEEIGEWVNEQDGDDNDDTATATATDIGTGITTATYNKSLINSKPKTSMSITTPTQPAVLEKHNISPTLGGSEKILIKVPIKKIAPEPSKIIVIDTSKMSEKHKQAFAQLIS